MLATIKSYFMKSLINIIFLCLSINCISQIGSGIIYYTANLSEKQKKEYIEKAENANDMSMKIRQKIIDVTKNAKADYFELHF